jgi:signal transduction histidine kinase
MARQLSDLLSSKEQLLLDVSHELRSPLTRLKVQLELLRDAPVRQALCADVSEMEKMVTTILEQAQLHHLPDTLNIGPVDLADLVRTAASDFGAGATKVICGRMAPVRVEADRGKLKTVLGNLLDNAVKNTHDSGQPVRVTVACVDDQAILSVEDGGIGIPETDLPRVFEPFYRADASRSRKTGGFGLGLTLCKAIVEAHSGRIDIASTEGRGTRVTVILPVSAGHARAEQSPPVNP